jgi:hypothetical protein
LYNEKSLAIPTTVVHGSDTIAQEISAQVSDKVPTRWNANAPINPNPEAIIFSFGQHDTILPDMLCIQCAQTLKFYQNFQDRPPLRTSTQVQNLVTLLSLENMSKQLFSLHRYQLRNLGCFHLWLRNRLC